MPEEIAFEWDEANLCKLPGAGRGVTPALCEELKHNQPKFFAEVRDGKTANHWMIAPDNDGRFWTIVVVNRVASSGGRSAAGRAQIDRYASARMHHE